MAAATPGRGGDRTGGSVRIGFEGEGESPYIGPRGGAPRGGFECGGESGSCDPSPGFGALSPENGAAAPSKTSMQRPHPCVTVE